MFEAIEGNTTNGIRKADKNLNVWTLKLLFRSKRVSIEAIKLKSKSA
jgi:hypothetical protein